jgi:GDP-mannose 6-dehydrogenase
VSAACLAHEGHEVIGVDPQKTKVDLINAGRSPIVERDLGEMMEKQVVEGRLRATGDVHEAVRFSDLSIVCVGTPSLGNGHIDLQYVGRVCEQIGVGLRDHPGHTVVIRSTLLPGTMREVVIPALERSSGLRAGQDFGIAINPEFLREGTAIHDYFHPPKTVIGELDRASGDVVAKLYGHLPCPLIRTDYETAEMVKYADNAWHALKVTFANEIGNICKGLGLDSHKLMEIFCQDTKLNLSPYYLKPGFAFGGSCLPKDVRALTYKAKQLDVSVPVLNAILPSNREQVERAIRTVVERGERQVGILGFSFKAGTDELRESPMVELMERLIGKGFDLRVYDSCVRLAAVSGANRDYILNHSPHISKLMVESVGQVLDHARTIVIGNSSPEFREVPRLLAPGQSIVDLVRISDTRSVAGVYDGICW